MKKILILCIALFLILLCGCNDYYTVGESAFVSDRFITVSVSENADYWEKILCDTETGALYLYLRGPYQAAMTPLLKADGTPLLWEGES